MDDRLQKGLDHANYRAAIHEQRQNLKTRLATTLLHAHNGGTFTVTPTLISFVSVMAGEHGYEQFVLLDDRDTPILIEDPKAFLEAIMAVYYEATNEYLTFYAKLRKARTVKALVGL